MCSLCLPFIINKHLNCRPCRKISVNVGEFLAPYIFLPLRLCYRKKIFSQAIEFQEELRVFFMNYNYTVAKF
jgi:hypothetical protein